MKNFFKAAGVTLVVAFGVNYFTGWPFWTILILLGLGYGFYAMRSTHPQIAKWLGVVVVAFLIGGWGWSWFQGNMPFSRQTLPYAKNWRDTQLAGIMDPGLSKARTVLVFEIRKKEDLLAADIPGLMQATNYAVIVKRTQELIDLRKEIEKLLAQTNPPKLSPAKAGSPPRDLGWQRWEVKPTASVMVRVFNGDEFVYRSPAALKVSEVGGIEHLHNASATPGEIRSFKFYDLPAEGREIKILPVDGTTVFWLDFRIEGRRT